jgi:hypothetical protein
MRVQTAGGTRTTQTRKSASEGCNCSYDPETKTCCSSGKCGCRKSGQACNNDCSCSIPICNCIDVKAGRRAAHRIVKKEGPNIGRGFWCCGKSEQKQCNFFVWAAASQTGIVLSSQESTSTTVTSAASCSSSAPNQVIVMQEWDCPACTFHNKATTKKCEICQTAIPSLSIDLTTVGTSSSSSSFSATRPKAHTEQERELAQTGSKGNMRNNEYCSPCTNQFGTKRPTNAEVVAADKKKKAVGGGRRSTGTGSGGDGNVGGRKRKECERGYDCPYKGEYQHGLEFTHPDVKGSSSGGGGKRGGSGFVAFGGKGHSLGNG